MKIYILYNPIAYFSWLHLVMALIAATAMKTTFKIIVFAFFCYLIYYSFGSKHFYYYFRVLKYQTSVTYLISTTQTLCNAVDMYVYVF
jgi:hypothetical protein